MHYCIFLAFEVDAESQALARTAAKSMVDGELPFPDTVACVGIEYTPTNDLDLVINLLALGAMMTEQVESAAR